MYKLFMILGLFIYIALDSFGNSTAKSVDDMTPEEKQKYIEEYKKKSDEQNEINKRFLAAKYLNETMDITPRKIDSHYSDKFSLTFN